MDADFLLMMAIDAQKAPYLTLDKVLQDINKARENDDLFTTFPYSLQSDVYNELAQKGYDIYICKASDTYFLTIVSWQMYEEGRQGIIMMGLFEEFGESLKNLLINSYRQHFLSRYSVDILTLV